MEKAKIYITRKLPKKLLEPFMDDFTFKMWDREDSPVPTDILYKEAEAADGLLCLLSDNIDREFLSENKHLKIVANLAVGYDNIDLVAAKEFGIITTNTPDVLTETTADLTFALLMATARRLIEANERIKADKWKEWAPFMLAGTDIYNKTIGIVGMGRIGEAVARRARGFNMNILYYNRNPRPEVEKEIGAGYRSFTELLTESDYIVSLVPLSDETHHLFNATTFKQMKSTAIFINVSRGAVVDEEALYHALVDKEIQAAGLDVFEEEPISSNHPLVGLNNVTVLPHIGSASLATREKMIGLCLENIELVFQGKMPKTPIG